MTATTPALRPGAPAPHIRLEGVRVGFQNGRGRRITVVDDLDLDIPPGRFVCVAGRSGSGKTSLLRLVLGEITPDAGSVWWGADAIATLRERERLKKRHESFGYISQTTGFLRELTTLENVLVPVMVRGRASTADVERAEALLAAVGLDDKAATLPATLSGGQALRASIARALMPRPPVLVADEPTASLDRETADEMIALLGQANRVGVTVIAASHDPHLIDAADAVLQLEAETTAS